MTTQRSRIDAAPTHEPRSPPTFRERVQALAGKSTFREPSGPGSTDARRAIPADHMVAAALSFGRRNADDIGPDIAFDMATGRMGHHIRVCSALGSALGRDRSVLVRRNRPYIAVVAYAGYLEAIGMRAPVKPEGMRDDDWEALVGAAVLILERLAEDAVALAGRRARRAA
ncbi:MAG: hypothetical protein NDI84_08250 [Steroidobacteraceae bacterium]|nr:hypothetical protein [Steroidobacteraceae bacterium]